uniref:Chromosome 11 open reading frame 16 n=1 Tax=Gallus gallus TaxID=9031 RepID=A0A8V0ZEU9_CHICK
MAHAEGFLPMDHRYCSMMPALDKFPCSSAIPAIHPCCRSSFAVHPAWITKPLAPLRCQRFGCCLPSLGPAWQRLSTSQRSAILAKNVPVLVRGEHDGFYYRGTVKEEMENERGMFLVEFTRPLDLHGRHSVCVQKAAKDDILEYANGMKHSLLPGDKVLAPWEPDLVRYGPGTVLTGIETRDPLRASEDEEITVQFWNDKKVKLPRGVALWIHPSLHAKHSLLCSPCWPFLHCCGGGMCCSSACVRCFCCCRGHSDVFWPLPPKSQVFQRGAEEAELSSKSSPRLLELEGPKQGVLAAVAARSLSSDSEVFPTQSTAVDSTVDTDPSCPEKPRRNHCKSRASNSAISVVDMSRVAPPDQTAVFETTEQPPGGQFTMNEMVKYRDFKLSSVVR